MSRVPIFASGGATSQLKEPRVMQKLARVTPPHSGPGWGNFVTGPQIFVFKIEPGARSYMSGDPFGPKKPSISPYWDFAVTWQTSSWLKNGDFSRKKRYLLYGP